MEWAVISVSATIRFPLSKPQISSHLTQTRGIQILDNRLSSNELVSSKSSHRKARKWSQLTCVSSSAASSNENGLSSSPDVLTIDVKGMMCEGCTSSVKRILESQPQVSSAIVDLATETAYVQLVPEAKVTPNWQHQLGVNLAEHLTSCGFSSSPRGFPS